MLRQALLTVSLAAVALTPATAGASEVCVSCTGPDTVYRCTVDQSADVASYRYGKRVLQFVCITELARQGNHQKCRVQRGEGLCLGVERVVSLTAPLDPTAAADASQTAEADGSDGVPAPEATPQKPGPPKTVEELARRTASSSKEQLEKTGDAVGGAMKKSWNCLTSLFTQC